MMRALVAVACCRKLPAAGSTIQIVFVTNGENNAWPHQVVERQWRINEADRAHWGMRRRHEALNALQILGLARGPAHFLSLPIRD
jgi:LmbE family N-acetylglucosaminyl deacetylase